MVQQISLGGIDVDVVLKNIKNVHLSVYPPTGRVRISAPNRMSLANIRAFAISKLAWIKKHQRKKLSQEREPARDYIERESHYIWGRRYILAVVTHNAPPSVELRHRKIVLRLRPTSNLETREAVLNDWYRIRLKQAIQPIIDKWSPLIGVKVNGFAVRRMKTKWGSCNASAGTLLFNTDLAKRPPPCLEYIVVHEMLHLLVRLHDDRFFALLDKFMPNWRHVRQSLNGSPLSHVNWS